MTDLFRHYTDEDWKHVIFCDEKNYHSDDDGRTVVWRGRGTRFREGIYVSKSNISWHYSPLSYFMIELFYLDANFLIPVFYQWETSHELNVNLCLVNWVCLNIKISYLLPFEGKLANVHTPHFGDIIIDFKHVP